MKKDLERFGLIVPGLHALEQRIQRCVTGESRHRE
jgi:hypothetical protein